MSELQARFNGGPQDGQTSPVTGYPPLIYRFPLIAPISWASFAEESAADPAPIDDYAEYEIQIGSLGLPALSDAGELQYAYRGVNGVRPGPVQPRPPKPKRPKERVPRGLYEDLEEQWAHVPELLDILRRTLEPVDEPGDTVERHDIETITYEDGVTSEYEQDPNRPPARPSGWAWCACGWLTGRPYKDPERHDYRSRGERHLEFMRDGIDPASLRAEFVESLGIHPDTVPPRGITITRDDVRVIGRRDGSAVLPWTFDIEYFTASQRGTLERYIDYGPERDQDWKATE
jgi:hypothetical protein